MAEKFHRYSPIEPTLELLDKTNRLPALMVPSGYIYTNKGGTAGKLRPFIR